MKQALALAALFGLIYALTGLFAQEKGAPETMEQSLSAIIKLNKKMEKITFRTVLGEKKTLEEIGGGNATIVVFLNFQCPISNRYVPELVEMSAIFKDRKVNIIGVCCDVESPKELANHIQEFNIHFPVFYDPEHIVSTAFLADYTPQVFLMDSVMTLRYFGRINDQYEDRATRNFVIKTHDLRDALSSVLANKEVLPPFTQAVGCSLERVKRPVVEEGKVTFYRDVLPILQKNCQECHRKGEVGPFPILTYQDAYTWAELIRENVVSGIMPPWKPSPRSIPLKNKHVLSKEEIETVNNWVEGGCAKGKEKEGPPPRVFKPSKDWKDDRAPDIILEYPADVHIGPRGDDHYRTLVYALNNKEELYVEKTQFIPGNSKIVHHSQVFYDATGQTLDAQKKLGNPNPPATGDGDWGPGYNSGMGLGYIPNPAKRPVKGNNLRGHLGGWAPNCDTYRMPLESSYIIPSQSDVLLQIHYHRTGKKELDRSKLGIWLSKKPPTKFIKNYLVDTTFTIIPAGIKKFKATGSRILEEDSKIFVLAAHAHKLGKENRMYYTLPGNSDKVLIFEIKDWDFNWQQHYYPVQLFALPKGTTLHTEWIYDNSNTNPNNFFHPPKNIFLGETTNDEMGFDTIACLVDKKPNGGIDMLIYFEKLLKAEALKKVAGGK